MGARTTFEDIIATFTATDCRRFARDYLNSYSRTPTKFSELSHVRIERSPIALTAIILFYAFRGANGFYEHVSEEIVQEWVNR